jgi:hypothetical protein
MKEFHQDIYTNYNKNDFWYENFNENNSQNELIDELFTCLNLNESSLKIKESNNIQNYNDSDCLKRPNRPVSYYIATNFHPLDISLLTSQKEKNTNETISNKNNSVLLTKKKWFKKENKTKETKFKDCSKNRRLSRSLGDIIKITKAKSSKISSKILNEQSNKNFFNSQNYINIQYSDTIINKDQQVESNHIHYDTYYQAENIKKLSNKRKNDFILFNEKNSTMPVQLFSHLNKEHLNDDFLKREFRSKSNYRFRSLFGFHNLQNLPNQTPNISSLSNSSDSYVVSSKLSSDQSGMSLNNNTKLNPLSQFNFKRVFNSFRNYSSPLNNIKVDCDLNERKNLVVDDERSRKKHEEEVLAVQNYNLPNIQVDYNEASDSTSSCESIILDYRQKNETNGKISIEDDSTSPSKESLKNINIQSQRNLFLQNSTDNSKYIHLSYMDDINIPFIDDEIEITLNSPKSELNKRLSIKYGSEIMQNYIEYMKLINDKNN